MSTLQTRLDYADAVADCFLDVAETAIAQGQLEDGLKYIRIAAMLLVRQNRVLTSARIESLIQLVARALDRPKPQRRECAADVGICLHVISEALPFGGITAMAARWIRSDCSGMRHSVALLEQRVSVPDQLLEAARDSGGEVYRADSEQSLLERAGWLRSLTAEGFRYIILHIDVSDVIAGVALGIPGGPPVLLVNHTAHLYWTGTSVIDVIVNCRGSQLEGLWASVYRGTPRYASVPIPLPEPAEPRSPADAGRKGVAKKRIGVPDDAVVLLTVGASFKYLAANGLDFVQTIEELLCELPEVVFLVAGTPEDKRWRDASRRSGGRIRALGTVSQVELSMLHEAADLYVEGFPFGTTTSLLEAGLRGVAAVLSPAQCPPPYGSDGLALDGVLNRATSTDDYKAAIIRLVKNTAERSQTASRLQKSIVAHHTGAGWRRHLTEVLADLPLEHGVHLPVPSTRTPAAIHEYWAGFQSTWGPKYEETLEIALLTALTTGLRPKFVLKLKQICKQYRSIRKGSTVPSVPIWIACNYMLPIMPKAWRIRAFRLLCFLCRQSLLPRLYGRVVALFGRQGAKIIPYGDYRIAPRQQQLTAVDLSERNHAAAAICCADEPAKQSAAVER